MKMLAKIFLVVASVVTLPVQAAHKLAPKCSLPPSMPHWQHIANRAEFTPRDVAKPIKFSEHMWISNGYRDSKTVARDLWKSKDGRSWELVNEITPYEPYAGVTAYKGAIYAVKTAVWRSVDGKKWEQINKTGPLKDKDASPFLLVLKGKMLLLSENQVWSSEDGLQWQQEPKAPYGERTRYAVTVLNDAIYVMGGAIADASTYQKDAFYPNWLSYNDVWKSTDGQNWKQLIANAPWDKRMWPSVTAHKGKLILVGGFDNERKTNFADTWLSDDGKNWCLLNDGQFPGRHWPTLFSKGDDVLMVAGNAWPVMNDVWKLHLP